MIVIAADPGTSGAIAAVCSRRGFLQVLDLPTCDNGSGEAARVRQQIDPEELREIVRDWSTIYGWAREDVVGVIERLQPFTRPQTQQAPKFQASAVTLMSMGYSAGIIEGTLRPFVSRIVKPLPREWKRVFGLAAEKAGSVECARRLYGDALPKRLRHDKAEAVLLARWGVVTLQ